MWNLTSWYIHFDLQVLVIHKTNGVASIKDWELLEIVSQGWWSRFVSALPKRGRYWHSRYPSCSSIYNATHATLAVMRFSASFDMVSRLKPSVEACVAITCQPSSLPISNAFKNTSNIGGAVTVWADLIADVAFVLPLGVMVTWPFRNWSWGPRTTHEAPAPCRCVFPRESALIVNLDVVWCRSIWRWW